MNRRTFLVNLTAAAATLALAACRGNAPSATVPAPTPAPPVGAGTPTATAASSPTPAASAAATRPVFATPVASATPSGAASAPPGVGPAGRALPLFDTHVHYSEDAWGPIPVPQALALMDLAGTQLALVSSTPDEGTMRLHRAAPERIIPILRPYRTRDDIASWHGDPTIVPYLEERLALGVHRGIGEFHLYGDDARSAVVGRVLELAAQRRLLLHAHADLAAIERLFERDPNARILWAHAGYADPPTLRRAVERYPTLWIETAIRGEIGAGGQFAPDWRDLFIAYPDRFMIGTDSYIVARWQAMPTILGDLRVWCQALPAPVGAQLAWRNAARLLGVSETTFKGD